MRDFLEYIGLGIVLAGLALMGYAGYSAWQLHKARTLSFAVMDRAFWWRVPQDYLSGLTPNSRWFLMVLGGFVIFLVGRHIRNQALRFSDNERNYRDPGDGDYL